MTQNTWSRGTYFKTETWPMYKILLKILLVLGVLGSVITVIFGIPKLIKLVGYLWTKLWYFLTRYRPKVPRETIRVIPRRDGNRWSLGSSKGEPSMQVVCGLYVTNISDLDVLICEVSLRKPKTVGHIFVRHPHEDIYGTYSIPAGQTTEAVANFWIKPPICKEDEILLVDIDFVDQFRNSHRVRKVEFHPKLKPKKNKETITSPAETVSEISDPVEKEIVAVLQAEIDRYRQCGRYIGGLGSIQTTYEGRTYCGVGVDYRKVGSPKLQAIVPDPETVKIESDNGSTLIEFYHSLKSQQKNDFVESLLKRLSREGGYASVGYFILFVLYNIGYLNKALETAKKELQNDSAYGFSDFLRLLDGLLRYQYPKFSTQMLDDIERFLKGIGEHTFRISERLSAIRTFLLAKRIQEE